MAILIPILVVALAFLGIHYAFTVFERRRSRDEFDLALEELRKDPDNKQKRDAALVRGRTYWSVRRNMGPLRPEDEAAVTEQIQAVIYKGTLPANRQARRVGGAKIVDAPNLRRTRIDAVDKSTWNIPGRTQLRQLRDELGFEVAGGDRETLAELVERLLMRAPKFGDHVVVGSLDIAVTKVEEGRASKLFVRMLE